MSGFLVDVDHLLDYAFWRGGRGEARIVLPLHGWEFLPVLIWLERWLGTRGYFAAGYALHLGIDQITNEKRSRLAYFISYRLSKRFSADQLGSLDPERRHRWRRASLLGLARWL